jgi:hypothetical protein
LNCITLSFFDHDDLVEDKTLAAKKKSQVNEEAAGYVRQNLQDRVVTSCAGDMPTASTRWFFFWVWSWEKCCISLSSNFSTSNI